MKVVVAHSNCIVNDPPKIESANWTLFLVELGEAIERVIRHGRAYIVVSSTQPDEAFVQFGVTAQGPGFAEVAATVRCPRGCGLRHAITSDLEQQLATLGWLAPSDRRAA